jgi:CMP-N-acetylneuraminic acid synthetase
MSVDSASKIVALLPMKAHSERVPGKNFREFCEKPLYRWILDTLLSLSEVSTVAINTDAHRELAATGLVEDERVQLRERPQELRGDAVSMNRILADDVAHVPADLYLMTHTTNPLLRAETIRRAIDRFLRARERGEADSLFAANRFQVRFYGRDGRPINHDPEHLVPTQDLEPWFAENSNLYLFTRESFRSTSARIGERPLIFEMAPWESVDIDDEPSWQHAELLARELWGGAR